MEKQPRLKVSEYYHLEPAGEQRKSDPTPHQGDLVFEVHNLGKADEDADEAGRVAADIGDFSGKVRFELADACKRDGGAKLDCPVVNGNGGPPGVHFYLRALKAGRVGDSGWLRFTYTSPQGQVSTARTKVVIGRPQLGVKQLPMQERTESGGRVPAPMVFKNVGEVTARGIAVSIGGKVEPSPAKRHRNCRYKDRKWDWATTCYFPDARVRPGETRTLKPAPSVRSSGSSMYEALPYGVAPLNDPLFSSTIGWDERSEEPEKGSKSGKGSTVRLVEAPGERGPFIPRQRPGAQDLENDSGELLVQRDTHIDYEAIGARASGTAGDTVRIRVGLRNNGPGTFTEFEGEPEPGENAVVKVTIPPGATVLRAPREAIDIEEYDQLCKRHHRTYTCHTGAPGSGESDKSLEFLLRVRESGTGKVELPDEPLPRRDPTRANDSAAITLHAEPDYARTALILITVLAAIAVAATLFRTRHHWTATLRRIARHRPHPPKR